MTKNRFRVTCDRTNNTEKDTVDGRINVKIEIPMPVFTCDCGAPIDKTTGVSMCRACFDSCTPCE